MRPRGATSEQTRQRVRAAAVHLFATHGYGATGIRDIAAAAGLSSSSLYEYVSSKEDLLVEIMRACIEPLLGVALQLRRARLAPAERLAALAEQHVRFHVMHAEATLVTDTEIRALDGQRRAEVVALRDDYEREWRRVVTAGQRDGSFVVTDVALAARALIAVCTGVTTWYRPDGSIPVERLCAQQADLALGLVRASRDGVVVRRRGLHLPPVPAQLASTA